MSRRNVNTFKEMKVNKEKIVMVTAYDYPSAKMVQEAELDMILVGDSLGMAMLGYDTTLPVTVEDMIHHTKAVTKGAPETFVVGDMPFLSYHVSTEEALINAGRFLKEAGAQAVKLEGGQERASLVKKMTSAGIPVMGHIGLTPQSVHQLGGYKVQGKQKEKAIAMVQDAKALEEAGAFSIVLECVPNPLAELISDSISIPTIGIGAGNVCDGQVLVWHDLLGITEGRLPRFVKKYADLRSPIITALKEYKDDVCKNSFPGEEHSFSMKEEELPKIY